MTGGRRVRASQPAGAAGWARRSPGEAPGRHPGAGRPAGGEGLADRDLGFAGEGALVLHLLGD
ncbi:hypothetical protein, partial [Streptomyces sp. JJ38]|uniref:hypothetical protein n=1 Tax=Streptomyces sp. JJ38 TaxID=2738128 RepID=UPI001C591BFC